MVIKCFWLFDGVVIDYRGVERGRGVGLWIGVFVGIDCFLRLLFRSFFYKILSFFWFFF